MSATWTMRDGTQVPIAAMTDEHLLNAFKMARRVSKDDPRLPELRDEIIERLAMGKRGEGMDGDDSDLLDDCVIGGCDNYGSLHPGQE